MQKSNEKPYALMAGAYFGIYELYCLIFKAAEAADFWVVHLLSLIGITVALFLKNEKAVIAAAGIGALYNLYLVIKTGLWWYCFNFSVYSLIAALILMTRNNKAVAQKVWFIPGTAVLLYYFFLGQGKGVILHYFLLCLGKDTFYSKFGFRGFFYFYLVDLL